MINNTIKEVLALEVENLDMLLESGIRIPPNTKKAKILHHDDFDGIMSAVAMALQLKRQGVSEIITGILHDRDTEYEQEKKLAKREGEMLVVVDFDRFKNQDLADAQIDAQTDHHELRGGDVLIQAHKSVGKKGSRSGLVKYGSDVLHISTAKAQGFIQGTDLEIMNAIDSAQFGKDVSTNIYLQRQLKANDGAQRKKMRLAIITSSIVGQLVRGGRTVNPGAVQSIIEEVIKQPSIINFYNQVKKHVTLQKEQAKLIRAYEGKNNGNIDWDAIKEYNEKVPRQMKIGILKTKEGEEYGIRKDSETGRAEAASEEELAKRNKEKQASRDLDIDPRTGESRLKSQDPSDASLKPWELKDKYAPIPKAEKSRAWAEAEQKARNKTTNFDSLSREEQKKLIVPHWKKLINELQKGKVPGIIRKSENISLQTDMKGNRYLAYEDQKIAANIRDFWKFWQMAMSPGYYEKFEQFAKDKGLEFKPEEINLVELGKKAMEMAKSEMFTEEELSRRGFENPSRVLEVLNNAYDISYAKSGGHTSITNIDLKPIYGETYDKYNNAMKRAIALGKDPKRSAKMKAIEQRLGDKAKRFSTLLREFKQRIQDLLTQAVQGRITRTKKSLSDQLRQRAGG